MKLGFMSICGRIDLDMLRRGPERATSVPVSDITIKHSPNFNVVDFELRLPSLDGPMRWSVHHDDVVFLDRQQDADTIPEGLLNNRWDVLADNVTAVLMPISSIPKTRLEPVDGASVALDFSGCISELIYI